MTQWSHTQPPSWFPTAVATSRGWENPVTGEVLVAIRNLEAKGIDAAAVPTFVAALVGGPAFLVGAVFRVNVTASEPVRVTNAATIIATFGATERTLAYNDSLSTDTVKAFTYTLTAEDIGIAGTVSVGTEIIGGQVKDILPGGNVVLVPQASRIFAAIDTSLVTVAAE